MFDYVRQRLHRRFAQRTVHKLAIIVETTPLPGAEIKSRPFLHPHRAATGAGHDLAAGIIYNAPINLYFILALSDGKAAATNKRDRDARPATAEGVFLRTKARDGALEGIVCAFPLSFLHRFSLRNLTAFTQRPLGAAIVQSH